MKNICFYFELHQPVPFRKYKFFEIGQDHYYVDDFQTGDKIRHLAEISYLPANNLILDMIRVTQGKFKCAFSISGIMLEQLEQYAPEVIDSFKELAKTESVEFLAETYAHSLASVYDENEFERQVKLHSAKVESLFGKKPTAFRNTELIYSDEIGEMVNKMGYKTVLIEEAKHVLGWKSPNHIYTHSYLPKLKLLIRNNGMSNDIAFRFSNRSWDKYPLDAQKFISWISDMDTDEEIVNIWMGYDALGVYQSAQSGIFDFIKALPSFAMEHELGFVTPSEATKKIEAKDALPCPYPISWSANKDLTAWNGNDLQNEALSKLYAVSERVRMCKDKPLLHDWLFLQISDHFRFMSHNDAFGTYYVSPYEAFLNYMNILADFLDRVDAQYPTSIDNEELNELLKTINNQEKEIESLEKQLKTARARKAK